MNKTDTFEKEILKGFEEAIKAYGCAVLDQAMVSQTYKATIRKCTDLLARQRQAVLKEVREKVIGNDEDRGYPSMETKLNNELRAEQRKEIEEMEKEI